MEITRIYENKSSSKIYGLIGNINITTNNTNYSIVSEYKFKGTVKEYLNSSKDIQALKLVMLDESYLDKTISDLSDNEIKIVNLASVLIANKENIVLDYFEKGLNNQEKASYQRLFKKLAANYHKKIIIFTNDFEFVWDLAEELIIVEKNEVINSINKNDYFKIMNLIDKPEITKFIDLVRTKNIKIENYKNTMDLLKAIYRIKENK